jgi:hypothetical protein
MLACGRPMTFAVVVGAAAVALAAEGPRAKAAAPSLGDRACVSSLRSAKGFANLGTPATDAPIDVAGPVWHRSGRTFTGVSAHRERGRVRLRVCSATTSEIAASGYGAEETRTRTLRAHGVPVVVGQGQRATAAAVADPWVAWSTRRAGREGFRIARRTIGGGRVESRAFQGRLLALALTRDGTAVVSTITGRVQRVYRWRPSGRTDALTASRRVRLDARGPIDAEPTGVRLWDPDTVWLVPPGHDPFSFGEDGPLDPGELVATRRATPCRAWSTAAGVTTTTRRLRAVLQTSDAWSRTVGFADGEWVTTGSKTTLEVCDRTSGAREIAFDAGYDTTNDDEAGLDRIRIVGDAVLGAGGFAQGYTGSGSSAGPIEAGFVRPATPGAAWREVSGRNLATPEAAAWTEGGSVWVSDAAGTRAVAAVPSGFLGLRLAPGVLTIVSGTGFGPSTTATGEQRIAIVPLRSGDAAGPDLRPTATNFGICSDQFASYCPDPR